MALAAFIAHGGVLAAAPHIGPAADPSPAATETGGLERIRSLIEHGRYAEAEESSRRLLDAVESASGPRAIVVADVLDLLVESLYHGGKRTEPGTLDLAERAVRIREGFPDGSAAALGRSICTLGAVIYAHMDLARARDVLERSLEVRKRAFGPDHPEVAASLRLLGEVHMDLEERELARERLERSLAIRERAFGPDHLEVAESLHSLGKLHFLRGDYVKARSLTERALVIRQKKLGEDHPLMTKTLNNLAAIEQLEGNYSRAKELHERALRIRTKTLGSDHPLVASSLVALGTILRSRGEFVEARAAYRRALDILEQQQGPKGLQYANTLSSFAQLLYDCGDLKEAKQLEDHVLAIRRDIHPPSHPAIASSLSLLGYLHMSLGDAASARAHFEQALAIEEAALDPNHPSRFHTLLGLASSHESAGDLAGAMRQCNRAFDIARSAAEPSQPQFLYLYLLRGGLLLRAGDLEAARRDYAEAQDIADLLPGSNSPFLPEIHGGDARVRAFLGEREGALEAALAAESVGRTLVSQAARTLPERQALGFATNTREYMDLVLSILDSDPGFRAEAKKKVWDAVVHSRALVLDEMARRNAALREDDRSRVESLAEALRSARQRLANLFVSGPRHLPADHYARLVDEARRESERAEEDLASRSLEFRQSQKRQEIGLDQVLPHLPAGAALVAFTRFDRDDFSRPHVASTALDIDPAPTYAAFVAAPGRDDPAWIRLGGVEIDSLVAAWRTELAAEGHTVSPAAEAACRQVGTKLRARIWDPVSPVIAQARRVFVVPDGSLNRITFSALPVDADRYLIESGPVIHLLSAERDLVAAREVTAQGSGLLALGGVDFDHSAQDERLADTGAAPGHPLFRGATSSCEHLDSILFETLPASEPEIDEVIRICTEPEPPRLRREGGTRLRGTQRAEVVRLAGTAASEAALKRLASGKAILHLATHGIFLDGRCASATQDRRGIGGVTLLPASAQRPLRGDNPLLLCGLALAGANRRHMTGPDEEDGILTAEEIATLELAGLEWAVLSACDTGIGEIRTGEGILGLRRAFQIAGAGTLIMSLWSVDDEAAHEWMRSLYKARFGEGLDTADAVHRATLASLTARRAGGESTHPFFWAGFVASGDWR